MAGLQLYLTSLEPDMAQTISSQSLGGYASTSLLYPITSLSTTVGLYDTTITLDLPSSGSWSEWESTPFIGIGAEIMSVSSFSNGVVEINQRGYNGIVNMHLSESTVYSISSSRLFNSVFNDNMKQYRCVALKNTYTIQDPSDARAIDLSAYISKERDSMGEASINVTSSIRFALEAPTSQFLDGTSTSWSSMQLRDSSIAGVYDDNHFQEAYLKLTSGDYSGQGRLVKSYDGASGTFVFYSSMPSSYSYSTNVSYEVFPGPAQRVKSGTVSPDVGENNITPFYESEEGSSLFPSINGFSGVLDPGDIVYLWIERSVNS